LFVSPSTTTKSIGRLLLFENNSQGLTPLQLALYLYTWKSTTAFQLALEEYSSELHDSVRHRPLSPFAGQHACRSVVMARVVAACVLQAAALRMLRLQRIARLH
jgi:hypothetical protein